MTEQSPQRPGTRRATFDAPDRSPDDDLRVGAGESSYYEHRLAMYRASVSAPDHDPGDEDRS